MELAGKRVLVTGASSGIGAELAVRFAAAGATVGICARRADRLETVLERCQKHAPESRMWVCDLAQADQVDELARLASSALGGVDVLVNNAGVPKRKHVTALDVRTVESLIQINYLSPIRLTLALLQEMIKRGSGLVVNISSVAAVLSSPGEAAYDASKAALSVFSEAMAIDLWETGVRVLIAYPGVVDTELFSVPDNDPLSPTIAKISVAAFADGVMDAIARDALQVYVPEWFAKIASGKAADVEKFLAGSAAWVRQQRQES